MKKVIVSTFNNSKNNYGALLQACALNSFIEKIGYHPEFVTINNRKKEKLNKITLKRKAKSIMMLPMKSKFKRREKKFFDFANNTQNRVFFENEKELNDNPPKADVYLSGSDQVWNPVKINDDLFLNYVPDECRKISYAASMGNENIPPANLEKFKKYIGRYDSISVREDSVQKLVSNFTNLPVHQNVDPVFLKTKEEWAKLSKPYELEYKKYILVYIISWNNEYKAKLQKIKDEMKLPIVSVNIGNLKNIGADKVIYDASPEQFLYLLNNAELVISTSFHGSALPIVLNKPFISLNNSGKNARIASLLRHFDLESRNDINNYNEPIDFGKINGIIEIDRQDSENYLKNAIEGEL